MGPIDYSLPNVPNPVQSLMQGLQFGAGLAQIQAQRDMATAQVQAQQAALQRQQQFNGALQAFFSNPNRQFKDLEPVLALSDKDQLAALKEIGSRMDARELEAEKLFSGQILAAVELDPNQALKMLDERISAESDPAKKQTFSLVRDSIKANPEKAGQTLEVVGASRFGKDWYDSISKLREDRRKDLLAPVTLRKETAEAIIKEAEAKFAPEKVAEGLNLTREQIKQAQAAQAASRAAAAASGADARRKDAEAAQIAAGIVPAEKRPELEGKFRKEYNDNTKVYQDVKASYGRVISADDNAVGDLSLIFGYMKMLDPGSVVREGEFATAQNAAGVPERVLNVYNRVASGERLSPSQRAAFKNQAERLFNSAGEQEAAVRSGLERIAKGYGLNPSNIFIQPVETAPTPGGGRADTATVGGKTYTRPPNFTDAQWQDYKRAVGAK
jgi:hypothetical protein